MGLPAFLLPMFAKCDALPKGDLFDMPYNFLCEMAPYIEIWYAYWGSGGGVPAQKFGLFVTAGGWTCGKVCGSIACQYSTSHTHTPKKQKNNNKRCSDSDYSSIPAIPFGNSKNPYTRSLRFLGAAVRSTSFSLCQHSACKRSHPFGEDSGFVSHSEKQRSGQYYFKGCYGILECVFFFHLPCRLLQCVEIELLASVGRKCGCQPFAAHIR